MSGDPSTDEETSYYDTLTEEERRGTLPGSTATTAMALMVRRAQPNPVVERSNLRLVQKAKQKDIKSSQAGTQTNSKKEHAPK